MNAQQMIARYREGYSSSKITSRIGKAIIIASLTLGTMMFFGGLLLYLNNSNSIIGIGFVVFGIAFGISGWWTGLLLSTCGQLVKAQLDTAVHTSVVLDQTQKEAIISASLD